MLTVKYVYTVYTQNVFLILGTVGLCLVVRSMVGQLVIQDPTPLCSLCCTLSGKILLHLVSQRSQPLEGPLFTNNYDLYLSLIELTAQIQSGRLK